MGFGVLESKATIERHVPGTSILFDAESSSSRKHSQGKEHIVLVPQPSSSPNDPLNWPVWKKNLTFFSLLLSLSMGGVLGPILSPATADIAREFHISIADAAMVGGYPLMTAGVGAYIAQAWAPIMGKRSAYMISTAILFASTVWSSLATNFSSLIASRILQGFGNGAYESILIASVGDLFFLHERGKRIVLQNMVALGSATGSPILGGYISQVYGWRMQFRILIPFTVVSLLFITFACPEHAYIRERTLETDMLAEDSDNQKAMHGKRIKESTTGNKRTGTMEVPRTYWEELKPFSGFITVQNPLILLVRPFVCFIYPAVFWGFTVGGLWSAWSISLSIVSSQIFSGPPSFFDDAQVGFLSSFQLIFLIIGSIVGFLLSDWWPKFCARRNNGIFEPEFRLILLIPVLLVGIPALFGFGYYAERGDNRWEAASCLQGLIGFSSILAGSVAFGYVLDCHRNRSVEVSVSMIMLRNFFWFGSSYFLPRWLLVAKSSTIFSVIGGVQLGITLLSVVIYIYGKQLRWFIHQNDPLKGLKLV